MTILSVPVRDILPVVPFMACQDVRYYLNGIYVEPDPLGGVTIAATNGHILAVMRSAEGVASEPIILTWSKPVTAHAKSAHKKSPKARVELESLDGRLTVKADKEELYIQAGKARHDAKYPDWRKVVPDEVVAGIPGTYDTKYLVKALQAGETFGHYSGVQFYHSKDKGRDGPLLVRFPLQPDLLCMVMPMRADEMLSAIPMWAKKMAPVEAQKAA